MLLIITNRSDLAADYLIMELMQRDLPHYRLNSDDLAETEFEFRIENQHLSGRAFCNQRTLDLDKVRSVWYRRAVYPTTSAHLEIDKRGFVRGELRHLVEGFVLNEKILWVNPIGATNDAERKLYQLKCAPLCGLVVPPTLVTSNAQKAREFITQHGRTILKPIYQGLWTAKEGAYAIYTRPVNFEAFANAECLAVCPVLIQKEIPKGSDIRLTIVGESVFAVKITSGDNGCLIDWRVPNAKLAYEVCDVPDPILIACKSLMQRLGIIYGAFDFVCTPEEDWYFLEVNPAGEWAWLETELQLPFRQAFIELFYSGKAER